MVTSSGIPAATANELTRLAPGRIVIVGGTSAISADVEKDATKYTKGTVTRIGGADRYETAAFMSAATFSPGVPVVFLATGADFADALTVTPAAAGTGPVLLVTSSGIPAATANELTRLAPGRIVIVGGTSAISADVEKDATKYTKGTVTRIGGADRYETAALMSATAFASSRPRVFLATGSEFADALAAAPLGSPVLLVKPTCVPPSTRSELRRLSAQDEIVLGGSSAASSEVQQLRTCS